MKLILVVDDEVGVAEVLQAILGDAGYRVHVAMNGREALEQLATELSDLLLLDYMMPVMNGGDVLRAMHADARLVQVPVVLMSSLDRSVIERKASGYVAFLRKPFRIDEVLDLVARHVR